MGKKLLFVLFFKEKHISLEKWIARQNPKTFIRIFNPQEHQQMSANWFWPVTLAEMQQHTLQSIKSPRSTVHIYHHLLLPMCPKAAAIQVFCWDSLTRNELQSFPTPVNRLPAREGIDGFDIGCCLTQKWRHRPGDSPFLTLHIHHVRQSNGWDTGLPPGTARREAAEKGEGRAVWQISPSNVGEGNTKPTYNIPPLT